MAKQVSAHEGPGFDAGGLKSKGHALKRAESRRHRVEDELKRVVGVLRSPRPVATFASAHLLERVRATFGTDLKTKTIGILGMAFKGDSDDPRDSLAFKLRKVAAAEAKAVLATDVYIRDPSFVPLATVLAESDIIILAAPHREYRAIDPRKYPGKQFVDIWNFWKR